jgi:hypothetical protein
MKEYENKGRPTIPRLCLLSYSSINYYFAVTSGTGILKIEPDYSPIVDFDIESSEHDFC